jgi:hypothetical protein
LPGPLTDVVVKVILLNQFKVCCAVAVVLAVVVSAGASPTFRAAAQWLAITPFSKLPDHTRWGLFLPARRGLAALEQAPGLATKQIHFEPLVPW